MLEFSFQQVISESRLASYQSVIDGWSRTEQIARYACKANYKDFHYIHETQCLGLLRFAVDAGSHGEDPDRPVTQVSTENQAWLNQAIQEYAVHAVDPVC